MESTGGGRQPRTWLDSAGKWVSLIVGLIAIWQFLTGLNLVPGPTPVEVAERVGREIQGEPAVPAEAGDDGGGTEGGGGGTQALSAPSNLQLAGDCENGFTLTWDAVAGADAYVIERDGDFEGTEMQPVHQFDEFPDGEAHEYRVIAKDSHPSTEGDSPPSDESATAGPCSF